MDTELIGQRLWTGRRTKMSNQYVEVVRRWLADNDTPTCAWHAASAAYTAAEVHTTDAAYARYAANAAKWVRLSDGERR